MNLEQDASLAPFNTFGLDVRAGYLAHIQENDDLAEAFAFTREKGLPHLVLGGGSNVLLTKDFPGVVIRIESKGIQQVDDTASGVIIRAMAGEHWHSFVMHTLEQDWGGLENLSLIPGNVGASPMQNIGAYGVEVKDVFHSLDAYHIESGELHTFGLEDCQFGYRESVFKRSHKGQYVITSVSYRLTQAGHHTIHTEYGAIQQELEQMAVTHPTIQDVSRAVINIRQSKLPDPTVIGNAGSFFKNPVVEPHVVEAIQKEYEQVPNYPAGDKVKLAAGWLIEQAGWKGKDLGGYGVHDRQALVLVNRGGGTGTQLFDLSKAIIADIEQKFGIRLEREVNVV